jgi:WD40 repeat protein
VALSIQNSFTGVLEQPFEKHINFGYTRHAYLRPIRPGVFMLDGAGRVLQAGGEGTSAWLKDASSATPLGGSIRHVSQIDALALSADGRLLMTGSSDMTARLWDTATGQPLGEQLHHQEQVRGVSVSADGRRGLTIGIDSKVRLWDLTTNAPIGAPMVNAGSIVSPRACTPNSSSFQDSSLSR